MSKTLPDSNFSDSASTVAIKISRFSRPSLQLTIFEFAQHYQDNLLTGFFDAIFDGLAALSAGRNEKLFHH